MQTADLLAIEELNTQLPRRLKHVEQITWFLKGYQTNDLGYVTHINISKMGLKGKWPEALFKFSHLEYLNIQENELMEIPSSITKLISLQCLDARINMIDNLPNEIATLTNLKKLYLGDNDFETPPEVLKQCSALETIDFTNNFISEGCEKLLLSATIKSIFLKNNQLETFPFGEIKNRLKVLNLQENPLKNIPSGNIHSDELFV